jgi:hypothetical protein
MDATGPEPLDAATPGKTQDEYLARIRQAIAWMEHYYSQDTILSLYLLCLSGEHWPELRQLRDALLRVEILLTVHRARIDGHSVHNIGTAWVITPLPTFEEPAGGAAGE